MARVARTIDAGVGLLFILASAASAATENLIQNGDFDLDASGWVFFFTVPAVDGEDHGRCEATSNLLSATQADIGAQSEVYRCVTGLAGSTTYSLDGHFFFPAQTSTGTAFLWIDWLDSVADCNGGLTGDDSGDPQPSSQSNVWVRHEMLDLVSPAGTHSARVGVLYDLETGTDPLNLLIDGFHMVAAHGLLFDDGFENESTCRWSDEIP